MSVENKVVLITGAARGLGFEYARALGAAGARIVAGDIADCSAAVQAAGSDAIGVALDVTDIASADSMVELAMDGMTMLVVTHEMGFARQVATRVVFMDAGQIVEINEPVEFFANPQHERTRAFLNQILH